MPDKHVVVRVILFNFLLYFYFHWLIFCLSYLTLSLSSCVIFGQSQAWSSQFIWIYGILFGKNNTNVFEKWPWIRSLSLTFTNTCKPVVSKQCFIASWTFGVQFMVHSLLHGVVKIDSLYTMRDSTPEPAVSFRRIKAPVHHPLSISPSRDYFLWNACRILQWFLCTFTISFMHCSVYVKTKVCKCKDKSL